MWLCVQWNYFLWQLWNEFTYHIQSLDLLTWCFLFIFVCFKKLLQMTLIYWTKPVLPMSINKTIYNCFCFNWQYITQRQWTEITVGCHIGFESTFYKNSNKTSFHQKVNTVNNIGIYHYSNMCSMWWIKILNDLKVYLWVQYITITSYFFREYINHTCHRNLPIVTKKILWIWQKPAALSQHLLVYNNFPIVIIAVYGQDV